MPTLSSPVAVSSVKVSFAPIAAHPVVPFADVSKVYVKSKSSSTSTDVPTTPFAAIGAANAPASRVTVAGITSELNATTMISAVTTPAVFASTTWYLRLAATFLVFIAPIVLSV